MIAAGGSVGAGVVAGGDVAGGSVGGALDGAAGSVVDGAVGAVDGVAPAAGRRADSVNTPGSWAQLVSTMAVTPATIHRVLTRTKSTKGVSARTVAPPALT